MKRRTVSIIVLHENFLYSYEILRRGPSLPLVVGAIGVGSDPNY